jgi:hypothetical protein
MPNLHAWNHTAEGWPVGLHEIHIAHSRDAFHQPRCLACTNRTRLQRVAPANSNRGKCHLAEFGGRKSVTIGQYRTKRCLRTETRNPTCPLEVPELLGQPSLRRFPTLSMGLQPVPPQHLIPGFRKILQCRQSRQSLEATKRLMVVWLVRLGSGRWEEKARAEGIW